MGSGFPYCRYFFGTDFADHTVSLGVGFWHGFLGLGSGFPYCGYLEPEDFFGTDYTDFSVWGQGGESCLLLGFSDNNIPIHVVCGWRGTRNLIITGMYRRHQNSLIRGR